MLSCKEVTRLISESLERELPMRQRVAIRVHMTLCTMCRHFEANLKCLSKLIAKMNDKQLAGEQDQDKCMSEAAKARLREKIESAGGDS